jgi:hypothetical protein
MSDLMYVWWCNECEEEINSPEDHSQIYPTHSYIEKMRWATEEFVMAKISKDIHITFGTDSKNCFKFWLDLQSVEPMELMM